MSTLHLDIAVVGSGPSCYAYLLGLRNRPLRCAVFTSDKQAHSGSSGLHPKLFGEGMKIVDPLPALHFGPTCNFGGLSAAWGGLLAVPRRDELARIFGSKLGVAGALEIYRKVLHSLGAEYPLFVQVNGRLQRVANVAELDVREDQTYVLTGTQQHSWENAGICLAEPIRRLAADRGFETHIGAIDRIEFDEDERQWRLIKANSIVTICRKLVLAAGGIGNMQLLQGLYKEGRLATYDHVPLQLYCFQFARSHLLDDFSGDATPLRTLIRSCDFIAAAYCLASLSTRFLSKNRLTRLAAKYSTLLPRLYFVQLWHEALTYKINLTGPVRFQRPVPWSSVVALFPRILRLGLLPFFARITVPGEGFHYMSISDDDEREAREILDGLMSAYSNSLEVLGGLALASTILANPSLTFMVDAYEKAARQH